MIPDEANVRAAAAALAREGRSDDAIAQLREVVVTHPGAASCWLDLAALLNRVGQPAEAKAAVEAGLEASPTSRGLLEAKALLLRMSGDFGATEAFLTAVLARDEGQAWAHFHLGDLLAATDQERGEEHLRRAVELDPANADALFALIQGLERAKGPMEGRKLDEAHHLALRARTLGPMTAARHVLLTEVFARTCNHSALAAQGGFSQIGRAYAQAGLQTALLRQLAVAASGAERRELVEQHRIWGRIAEARASRAPIRRPAEAAQGPRMRLGFLSSDLRQHPVGYFAGPVFDLVDPERFELFVYSFNPAPADPVQQRIAASTSAYHQWPGLPAHDAAQRIADDRLDVLIDLGGSTNLNKVELMSYRPAPVQASWLGYPHSAGLEAIDHFICDPFNRPTAEDYLIEQPLVLPRTWIAIGPDALPAHPVAPPPFQSAGFVTFGTASQPYKIGPQVLASWARIVAATPGSKFAFVRPEAASMAFRAHVQEAFAQAGVTADRLVWRPVRGAHLPYYGEIDISLDTFPLTGGTTTVEALWMGVPVVSRVGEMFHERLSYSLLRNVGLDDLCVHSVEDYEAAAAQLAGDERRLSAIRAGLRARVRSGPLGQPEAFAHDFYEAVAGICRR